MSRINSLMSPPVQVKVGGPVHETTCIYNNDVSMAHLMAIYLAT